MKTIFITMSRGSSIRNFFNTGIIKKLLDNNLKVVVLSPQFDDSGIWQKYSHHNLITEPLLDSKNTKGELIIREFLKGAVFNKTVNARYRYRFSGKPPRLILYLPRLIFLAPLRYIPGFKKLIRYIDFKINPQPEHDYLFSRYKPDVVFATTLHELPDTGVIKSAYRFKVRTAGIPRSWDTISKILFYTKPQHLLVWSPFMKKQSVRYQDYKGDDVTITGVPQFDHYKKQDRLQTREHFCKQLGLNPDRKIILYGSTGGNCFNEEEYLKLIKKFIDNKKIPLAQVIIRPHPGYADDAEKFKQLERYPGFVVDRRDKRDTRFKDLWDISMDHLDNLFNSLYHADACINIASTLTLDALACDTPVININFDLRDDVAKNMSVKRLYKTDYIAAVTHTGATYLANSKDEYLNYLKEILSIGSTRDVAKEKFIKYFLYKNDGQSADRIVSALLSLAHY